MGIWLYTVIFLLGLLLVYLFWREINRPDKRRLLLRIALTSISVIALAFVIIPVYYYQEQLPVKQLVILTDGYNKDTVKLFLKNKNPTVIDHAGFTGLIEEYSTIDVFGNGLTEDELELIGDRSYRFHPSLDAGGLIAINWTKKIVLGEKLIVNGRYHNPGKSTVKIQLQYFSRTLDSVIISKDSTQSFNLTGLPTLLGNQLFVINVLQGSDTVEKEKLPVAINGLDTIKIAMVSSTPGFEKRFLKDWLIKHHYGVASRTAISKGKYEKSVVNIAGISPDHINPSMLNEIDVLIADEDFMHMLTITESDAIERQLSEKGMGLIIIGEGNFKEKKYFEKYFTVNHAEQKKFHEISVALDNNAPEKNSLLSVDSPLFIRSAEGIRAVIRDKEGNTLVGSASYGQGKMLFSVISNSYNWMLSGNTESYEQFWSRLIGSVLKKKEVDEYWLSFPAIIRENEPAKLILRTNLDTFPIGIIDGDSFFLRQDPQLTFQWEGQWWPAKSGWSEIHNKGNKPDWIYFFKADDWNHLIAQQNIEVNRHFAIKHQVANNANKALIKKRNSVPIVFFLIIFTGCCILLWMERKFSN